MLDSAGIGNISAADILIRDVTFDVRRGERNTHGAIPSEELSSAKLPHLSTRGVIKLRHILGHRLSYGMHMSHSERKDFVNASRKQQASILRSTSRVAMIQGHVRNG